MRNLVLALFSAVTALLLGACNEEKTINKYFTELGLTRLAVARDDVQPGGLIVTASQQSIYADNMLDYAPQAATEEYGQTVESGTVDYNAVMKKHEAERAVDVSLGLKFIEAVLPIKGNLGIKTTGKIKIDADSPTVRRMKVPVITRYLRSADSAPFRRSVEAALTEGKAFLIYETWRTKALTITAESGAEINADMTVNEIKAITLGEASAKFALKKTSKSQLMLVGDRAYAFAVRVGELKRGTAAGSYDIVLTSFKVPGQIIKAVSDEAYSAFPVGPEGRLNLADNFALLDRIRNAGSRQLLQSSR